MSWLALLRYQIFFHESSACILLIRIEWSTTVFQGHLLNFDTDVAFDTYKSSLAFDMHHTKCKHAHPAPKAGFFAGSCCSQAVLLNEGSQYHGRAIFTLFRVQFYNVRVCRTHPTVHHEAVVTTTGDRFCCTNVRPAACCSEHGCIATRHVPSPSTECVCSQIWTRVTPGPACGHQDNRKNQNYTKLGSFVNSMPHPASLSYAEVSFLPLMDQDPWRRFTRNVREG